VKEGRKARRPIDCLRAVSFSRDEPVLKQQFRVNRFGHLAPLVEISSQTDRSTQPQDPVNSCSGRTPRSSPTIMRPSSYVRRRLAAHKMMLHRDRSFDGSAPVLVPCLASSMGCKKSRCRNLEKIFRVLLKSGFSSIRVGIYHGLRAVEGSLAGLAYNTQ